MAASVILQLLKPEFPIMVAVQLGDGKHVAGLSALDKFCSASKTLIKDKPQINAPLYPPFNNSSLIDLRNSVRP